MDLPERCENCNGNCNVCDTRELRELAISQNELDDNEEAIEKHPVTVFLKSEDCKALVTKALTLVDNFYTEYLTAPNDLFVVDAIDAAISGTDLTNREIIALAINTDRVVAEANANLANEIARSKLESAGFTDKDGNPIKVHIEKQESNKDAN